jgi:hypothetical protein
MRLLAILVPVGLLIRIALLPSGAEGQDAADFILSLEEYDIGRFQPHFPGYPLYVLLAKGLAALGLERERALRLVGASAGALLPIPIALLLREQAGGGRGSGGDGPAAPSRDGAAVAAVAGALAFTPALLVGSTSIEADLPALLLVLFAFHAGRCRRSSLAGLIAGLSLGVRLGALPLVLGLFALCALEEHSRSGRTFRPLVRLAAGAAAGVLLWQVPQLLVVGTAFFDDGARFVHGHFTDWGGSVFTAPGLAERLAASLRRLALALGAGTAAGEISSLGGALVSAVLVAGLVLYGVRARRRADCWILFLALPQALTVALLQNPGRARHLYPLVLALVGVSLLGWLRPPGRLRLLGGAAALALAVRGVSLLAERSASVPPALLAVRTALRLAGAGAGAGDRWIFCDESARLFEVEAPGAKAVVRRARDLRGVLDEINSSLEPPERVLAFSEVRGQDARHASCTFTGHPSVFDSARVDLFAYRTREDSPGGVLRLAPEEASPGN